jgi:hypothetical protein
MSSHHRQGHLLVLERRLVLIRRQDLEKCAQYISGANRSPDCWALSQPDVLAQRVAVYTSLHVLGVMACLLLGTCNV